MLQKKWSNDKRWTGSVAYLLKEKIYIVTQKKFPFTFE